MSATTEPDDAGPRTALETDVARARRRLDAADRAVSAVEAALDADDPDRDPVEAAADAERAVLAGLASVRRLKHAARRAD